MASGEPSNASLTGEVVTQKAYTIGGVPIIFPYKAYPAQISMMDKIVRCLNKNYNCLLESPTGSGKSLALLCATLAWLKKTAKEINEMEDTLNQHLNAYGVTIPDSANCIKVDFEKYKHQKSNNNKNGDMKSGILNSTSSSNATELEMTSNLSCNKTVDDNAPDSKLLSSPAYSKTDKLGNKSSYFSDNLKKRGIIYIDEEEEDLSDFQPVKRNKLFLDMHKNIQAVTSSEDCKFLTSDAASPKQVSEMGNPEKKSDASSISDSPCASCSSSKVIESQINNSLPSRLPKIFFGTRTHKQIGQIIRELKKTPYKDVKMTLLSSRERTCIHPKNCRSRNKNEGCDELIKGDEGPLCNYYKNVKKLLYSQPPELSTAFDLEDFVSMCKRRQICPYFGTRELLQDAEIIFCPYNYLVDPLIRNAMSISLNGNILIMDEAHNIEDSAREAASTSVSVHQLQEAIANILQIGQLRTEESEPYMHISKVLENVKKLLENTENLNDYVTFDSSSKVWSGDDMLALLSYVGLGPDTFPIFKKNFSKIVQNESDEKEKPTDMKMPKLSGSTNQCLEAFTVILNYMYKDNLIYVPDYRCVIIKSRAGSEGTSIVPYSQSSRRKSYQSAFEITINFWCLNPSVAFTDFKKIHSLILASGTLSPLTSFQSELGIPFQISLETNHVVNKNNVWIGTIGKGPNNSPLNGTFQGASTFTYQDDIGNLVLEVCSVIPHGILCFLPSYGMLDKLAKRWQATGLWGKLLCKKTVVCEPRRNDDFQQIIQDFYEAIKESETNTYSDINGALFLAVCRGKVSEGLDFADNNARAVITIGIPFPAIKDPHVDLKKKYNDMHSTRRNIVTGSMWYEMQAFRALNQALGRCIRHKNDFGALIIVDERFQKYDRYVSALSKWIKKEIKHYSTCFDALSSLSNFTEQVILKNSSTPD